MSENNDTRIGRLEAQLTEQQEINKRNTDLLTEIAHGLKAMRDGATVAPKSFKLGAAVVEKGNVVGACMRCASPVRRPGKELVAVCPKCGEIQADGVFYGRLCADCPHVEGAHQNGAACVAHTVHNAPDVGNVPCGCVSFRLRENAQVEVDERAAVLKFLRAPWDGGFAERLTRIREVVPAVVFYRAAQERLDELKKVNRLDGLEARVIGRQSGLSYLELKQEQSELDMAKKIAAKETTPCQEYASYTAKIGVLMARGEHYNMTDLHELTRKAGEAWSRMSAPEKQAMKEELRKYVPAGLAPVLDDVETPVGLPVLAEKLPPLDPNRMRPVVLENRDEERADLKVVFSITRSQAVILEWGLTHPEVMGVKERFETVEDLAGAMLLPSFSYMLKHIASSRGKVADGLNTTKPGPGRDA